MHAGWDRERVDVEYLYYGLKLTFFLGLLRSFVKFDTLQNHTLFLGILYTAGIAFLSYVFFLSYQETVVWRTWEMRLVILLMPREHHAPGIIGWRAWQLWLVETLVLMITYLRLLARFDDGGMFWLILILGLGLIAF